MTWVAPSPTDGALQAVDALRAPSRPGPLPDSMRVGATDWLTSRSRDEVIAAYQRSDAPIPPGASAAMEQGVVVIRAPFSTQCLLFHNAPDGTVYSLADSPTLRITGDPLPASGDWAAAVGVDTDNFDNKPQLTIVSTLRVGTQDWLLWVSEHEDGPRGQGAAFLEAVDLGQLARNKLDIQSEAVPATIKALDGDGGATAAFKVGKAAVTVVAKRTHSMCALLQAVAAQPVTPGTASLEVGCVTKQPTGPADQRILGVGGTVSGKPWRLSTADLIVRIEAGGRFYVSADHGDEVPLTVAVGTSGTKYPLAKVEGDRRNLVVSLPKCRKVASPSPPPA